MLKNKLIYIKMRRILVKLFFVFIILIFVLKLINIKTINYSKENQLEDLNKKLNSKLQENNSLQEQINSGVEKKFVENFAREKLNMAYPRERVFVEVSK